MATGILYPGKALRYADPRANRVEELQERLIEVGCGPLEVDGFFGPMTLSAVKLYQTRRGLEADGVVGPTTWASLFAVESEITSSPGSPLLALALEVAQREVGVREEGGPNRGPDVEKYLASVGAGPGNPWCMAFAFYCFAEAAARLERTNPLVRTASVVKHYSRAPMAAKIAAADALDDMPKPGSIYCIDHGFGRGHCGIALTLGDSIVGVEGNTNASGGREGDGVYQRTRRWSEISLGFLDYSRLN